MSQPISPLSQITMPQMEKPTIDATDSSARLGGEWLGPSPVMLRLLRIHALSADTSSEVADRRRNDCAVPSAQYASVVKRMLLHEFSRGGPGKSDRVTTRERSGQVARIVRERLAGGDFPTSRLVDSGRLRPIRTKIARVRRQVYALVKKLHQRNSSQLSPCTIRPAVVFKQHVAIKPGDEIAFIGKALQGDIE